MSEESYERRYEVRWSDLDPNWHMRNTAYSEVCTQLRFSVLSRGGFGPEPLRAAGIGPVITREDARYRREVLMDEELRVTFAVAGLSESGHRFALRHEVYRRDGVLAATLELEGGWLDLERRRLTAPPPALKALLEAIPKTSSFQRLS